jgi:hypothetical protein
METYGAEPSVLWENQINVLNDAQVKQALNRLLKGASAHPPTLPEFLALAKSYALPAQNKFPDDARKLPNDETMAARWFTRRCMDLRFVGCSPEGISLLRREAIRICQFHLALVSENDPAATEQRIAGLLDDLADELYPIEYAGEWMSVNLWKPDQKYRH